ncbi:cation:proton antiporter [Telluria beijingensis]|uniref:cation:proton antiporter domain-containing protein n=1 Tax=Telluria beijingensis TaxID=3068633 RepID=UPI0027954335|nr:cation:proton antiporter [Massilia sp. REN29]
MHADPAFPFMREILLFLILAGILVPTLQRLRVNQVLGFFVVGAMLGPFAAGPLAGAPPWLAALAFPSGPGVSLLAEIGVLFLMFSVGLELTVDRLWAMRRWVFGVGSAQVALSACALAAALHACGLPGVAATILGLVLALSSTAVVMQLMSQRHMTGSTLGQAVFGILMLQDLAVAPLMILIGALAHGANTSGAEVAWQALAASARTALALALIWLAGRIVVQRLFRIFARERQPDAFMALILLATFGLAAMSAAAGLPMALGALVAGLLLAETEFRHEVELMVEPFRGLLMGLFFMTVGMTIDVRLALAEPLWVGGAVAGLVLVKGVVASLLLRVGGLPWGQASEGGLLLGQGGEFAFVVIAYASKVQVLEPSLGASATLVVGLSLLVTPLLARLGRSLGERGERLARAEPLPVDNAGVVIAGFGRVGQQLGKLLASQGIPYVAIEADAALVARLRAGGLPVWYGNAARAELLRKVRADAAPAIVLTMDQPAAALLAVRGIRRALPHARLFVRARDEAHAHALRIAGASVVVPETLEASLQLSAFVLEAVGVEERLVEEILARERDLFAAGLPQSGSP